MRQRGDLVEPGQYDTLSGDGLRVGIFVVYRRSRVDVDAAVWPVVHGAGSMYTYLSLGSIMGVGT